MSISVVIPAYNARPFIAAALDSVRAQTLRPTEILVVDDGSTDGTADCVRQGYPDVRLLEQPNRGVSAARNLGLDRATGDWVAFLDADDVWMPEKLARQWAVVQASGPDLVCVHTHYQFFGMREECPPIPAGVQRGDYSLTAQFAEWLIVVCTALVRRAVSPRFSTAVADGEDILYFAELSLRGRVAHVPEPLLRYRKHGGSQSDKSYSLPRNRRNCLDWLDQTERDRPALAAEVARARESLLQDVLYRFRMARYRRDPMEFVRWAQVLGSQGAGLGLITQEPLVARMAAHASLLLMPRLW